MSAPEIRLVRPEEHHELREVRLRALAYRGELASYLEREAAAPSEFWIDRAARASAAEELATFVAVRDGAFVGVADGFVAAGETSADIGGMWVAPGARRAGVGTALLAELCAWAQRRGVERIRLHVRAANVAACRLYERAGFTIATRVTTAEGATAFLMEKRL